jgi:hypothetical protein
MSFAPAEYDPDRPEGSGSSQYVTRKDIRRFGISAIVIFFCLIPVYQYYKGETQASLCKRNIGAIYKALEAYAEEYDGRLPAAYERETPGSDKPRLVGGLPITWASVIQPYFNPRASFKCPSADDDEVCLVAHPEGQGKKIELTYGMALTVELMPLNRIEDQGRTILIAESSNLGSKGAYDPLPLSGGDGFVLGFSNSNAFDSDARHSATAITRMAFPNTKDGKFNLDGESRHRQGIWALYASGHASWIKPPVAVLSRGSDGLLLPPWRGGRGTDGGR